MDVNNNIGYWLFYAQRCVGYAFAEALKKCCEEHNKLYEVTPAQFGLIDTLYTKGDGLTIGAIAQYRGVDAPTVTGIVKRLEQTGLVQRVHDTQDRRIVNVYLTAEGHAIMEPLQRAAKAFNDILLHDFSVADEQSLLAKLHQIINNLSAIGVGVGDRFMLLPEYERNNQVINSEDEKEREL
jgi:DNA-binding MarR family transcriptional regulator